MKKIPVVFVYSDKLERLPEMMGAALSLGESVHALVIGSENDAQTAASLGASTVHMIAKQEGIMLEDYTPSLAAIIRSAGQKALVLLPPSKRGRAMAGRLGVQLGAAVVNDVAKVEMDDAIVASRMVYGGLALGTEKVTSPVCVLTLAPGYCEPVSPDASKKAEVKTEAFVLPSYQMRVLSTAPKKTCSVNLGTAKKVVCVGRGLVKKEDLSMVEDLAKLLDAEMGCSRPVAEGEGWMERERYVGVSGVILKTNVYFALGISGQIQHMVGANASKVIIAINKDKNAPIFNCVDYGLVGDIYKVVPALLKALQ